jgi:flavin reductase (DIM6/NTAB) family NADH-FMN oxidoreductase RutF
MTTLTKEPLPDSLRRSARRFATGVTVVAVRHDGGTHGLTANSFVTLSLRPALVGISLRPEGRMRRHLDRGQRFGISVLAEGQTAYARHFARTERSDLPTGLAPLTDDAWPRVPSCVAFFACELLSIHRVGDHELIVGSVLACDVAFPESTPLIFLDGEFLEPRR